MFGQAEALARAAAEWLRLLVEVLGAATIAAGVLVALASLVRRRGKPGQTDFLPLRLELGRYLTLALELQLASDILATSIAPTWDRIGKLAAVAIIRSVLNLLLSHEIRSESASRSAR